MPGASCERRHPSCRCVESIFRHRSHKPSSRLSLLVKGSTNTGHHTNLCQARTDKTAPRAWPSSTTSSTAPLSADGQAGTGPAVVGSLKRLPKVLLPLRRWQMLPHESLLRLQPKAQGGAHRLQDASLPYFPKLTIRRGHVAPCRRRFSYQT